MGSKTNFTFAIERNALHPNAHGVIYYIGKFGGPRGAPLDFGPNPLTIDQAKSIVEILNEDTDEQPAPVGNLF